MDRIYQTNDLQNRGLMHLNFLINLEIRLFIHLLYFRLKFVDKCGFVKSSFNY